ncbi:hypothetical protein ACFP3U_20400 [Kitasatospora misakiensis]|uniref:Uncharacterized protein n=1 Tax=Kitasatospora misakiensis TaxID=67330 RepID=A0ABW0X6C1_9ACTN
MTHKRIPRLALLALAVAVAVPVSLAESDLAGAADPVEASCAGAKVVTMDSKRPLTMTDGSAAYAVKMVPYLKHCAILVGSVRIGAGKGANYQADVFPSEFGAQTGGYGKGDIQRNLEFSVIDRPTGGGTGIATEQQATACYDASAVCPTPDTPWTALKIE